MLLNKPFAQRLLFLVAMMVASSGASSAMAQFYSFTNIFPLEGVPGYTAEQMIENCGGEYADAHAVLWLWQNNGRSTVVINVRNAPPNEIFTVWLKLAGPSPLTGAAVTALANPEKIESLAAITPDSSLTQEAHDLGLVGDDGTGGDSAANGFRTNHRGNGIFFAQLDFPIIKGAYQFQEFDDSLSPVAISDVPFALRLASHCTDHKAHGLLAGVHEMFFDWSYGK